MSVEAGTEGGERPRWAEIAYEAIAPVYDDFTAHHKYEVWLGSLLPELERLGLTGNRLLDVACGTGKSFIPMLERGWEVTGSDVSGAMVELARTKVGDGAKLSVADMRDLPVFGEFDLVWCLDDAVNYLLSSEEMEQALKGMRRNLGPDGLLMFDVNTIEAYRTFFAEEVVVEMNGRRLVWKGRSTPDAQLGTISEASFEVLSAESGELLVAPEMHRQRHFPEAEVLAALELAGLECLDVFGHGDDAILRQPVREEVHSKAVYISRAAR
ncbi:MAG TPA: class I SAM-dependent methyltransferase [Solirubrobacterales bacterium]|jgi:ubiquinone/menaquinone biosynthesis C-methylase UbiE|nr:class I SAM-dependent methyltransferase [Solirubrobacterales bacterium]